MGWTTDVQAMMCALLLALSMQAFSLASVAANSDDP